MTAWAFLVGFCVRGLLGHLWVLGLWLVRWLCDVQPTPPSEATYAEAIRRLDAAGFTRKPVPPSSPVQLPPSRRA